MRSDDGNGVGSRLDQLRWDYEPPSAEHRYFLKPVGAFFGAFRWEGCGGQLPGPEDQGRKPLPGDV